MKRFVYFFVLLFLFAWIIVPFVVRPAFAHEQYVLTQHQLDVGFVDTHTHVLDALRNPENVLISVYVGIGITITLITYFFFQYSTGGRKFGVLIRKLEPVGHLFLRMSLAGSLIASAYFHAFMGPEIPLTSLPLGNLLEPVLYIIGILLMLGLFTRIVSVVGLVILLLATSIYGDYILTYLNYYGEYIALIVYGSYVLSVDNRLSGVSSWVKKYKDIELLIIRVTYGISVMYPAITIKLLHPQVIIEIVKEYHLNEIHWLFPSDPLLISLGTGLAQVLVGTMIIIGFETRLASFVTFLLYFLSVFYFKEAVWPHYVLLALALYLVINNGGKCTVDSWIGRKFFRQKKKS